MRSREQAESDGGSGAIEDGCTSIDAVLSALAKLKVSVTSVAKALEAGFAGTEWATQLPALHHELRVPLRWLERAHARAGQTLAGRRNQAAEQRLLNLAEHVLAIAGLEGGEDPFTRRWAGASAEERIFEIWPELARTVAELRHVLDAFAPAQQRADLEGRETQIPASKTAWSASPARPHDPPARPRSVFKRDGHVRSTPRRILETLDEAKTQERIAADAGLSREHVARFTPAMEEAGLIEKGQGRAGFVRTSQGETVLRECEDAGE